MCRAPARPAQSWRMARRSWMATADDSPPLRLVINSCSSYDQALRCLLESLEVAWFSHFDLLLIVIGGCDSQTSSQLELEPMAQWLPYSSAQVAVCRCKRQNFDYTGLHELHTYRYHPLVRARAYMFLLDTSVAEPDFLACFQSLRVGQFDLLVSPAPASNICAFGSGVVDRFGDNFAPSESLSKEEAIAVEHGESGTRICGVASFAERIIHVAPRIFRGTRDVYKVGEQRWVYFYPTFGICKYVHMRFGISSGQAHMQGPDIMSNGGGRRDGGASGEITQRERSIAAAGAGGVISLEKVGYTWDQTAQEVRVGFSLPAHAIGARVQSCSFGHSACKLRLLTPGAQPSASAGTTFFFDVAATFAAIDEVASRVRVVTRRDRTGSRVVLTLAKRDPGRVWPRLRA